MLRDVQDQEAERTHGATCWAILLGNLNPDHEVLILDLDARDLAVELSLEPVSQDAVWGLDVEEDFRPADSGPGVNSPLARRML